ncbi:MAG TPA: S46 family peptidase [Bryobacteraceae bacterium]|nr:S46 family peptidase [Bryobacteraceae bacterium]
MRSRFLVPALAVLLAGTSLADEGMWLFNQFPSARAQKSYGFEPDGKFLDHLRKGSVRLNNGGSGSFVSPEGLLFTNHHVASDCIQKLSTAEHNYMRDGFYAATREGEVRCPDLEVNVLVDLAEVTRAVEKAIPAGATPEAANEQRKRAIANLEKECADRTGNRCDVVTLFSGGRYDLYQYKKYTDVRLVFAPEFQTAFFGGDPDNFTYPRYNLDISFLRVYENGKPAATEHLRWSREGARDGELVFVAGNPGSTSRLDTMAQLEYQRDVANPRYLDRLSSRIKLLREYSKESAENARVAQDLIFGFENSFKAISGEQQGLRDPALMKRKQSEEKKMREAVARSPELSKTTGDVWQQVADAYRAWAPRSAEYTMLEGGPMGSTLFRIARWSLRLPVEKARPNAERLSEYRESGLESLAMRLYSPAPITDSLETVLLARHFEEMQQYLGADNPTVKAVLAGRTPQAAAKHYVGTSKLKDIEERKRLAGDAAAGRASEDGMMQLVRLLDAPARAIRKRFEDTIEAADTVNVAKIARARLAIYGPENEYPDATFTPRVTYGAVRGYRDRTGKPIPPFTHFDGLYKRVTGKDPYVLPQRWMDGKTALDLKTPFNFVSTVDITGGNSGSPTVNARNEVVGIVFDGNIESLPNAYLYDDTRARAVHVASQGILEALRKLYRTEALLKELLP